MADDAQQLLVGPDIIFQRRDIEIADQDHRIVLLRGAPGEEFFHALEEVELVRELGVDRGIGNVAAGRHIEIVDLHTALQRHAHVPGMALAAEILDAGFAERDFREDRHPVIGLLAVDRLVDIAQLVKGRGREQAGFDLGLLQAQHIRLLLGQETGDQLLAKAHRIDVPGGNFHVGIDPWR